MGQCGRLRFLQMGEPRHISSQILLHNGKNHCEKLPQQPVCLDHMLSRIESHVQRHLIIAASAGVHLLARIADAADQLRLHEAMNILAGLINIQLTIVYILTDSGQPFKDFIPLSFRKDFLPGQHGHMGHAALNILMK